MYINEQFVYFAISQNPNRKGFHSVHLPSMKDIEINENLWLRQQAELFPPIRRHSLEEK